MTALILNAQKREISTKSALNRLRKSGGIPATVYGLGKDPESVSLTVVDLRPIIAQAKRNAVVHLEIGGAQQKVVLKTVERDAIKRDIVHIDFLRVDNEHPLVVTVPVATYGVPFGVKTEGGVFSVMKKFVRVRGLIQDIPEIFNLDITELKAGTTFYVKDLTFDKGTFVTPPKTALFGITSVRKKEE